MKGNRGGQKLRSGRPSLVDERAVEELLSKSRAYINRMLFSEDEKYKNLLSEEIKFEAALRLVIKSIPQAVQSEHTERRFIQIIHELEELDAEALRALSQSCRSRALPETTA